MGCAEEECFPGCLTCFRVFINVFTTAGFILSLFVVASCQFFDYAVSQEGADEISEDLGGVLDSEGSIGLFHFSNENNDCADYPKDYNFDEPMGTARAGAIMAVFAGGLALICTLSEALLCALGMFCAIPTSFLLVIAVLGQCLTFAIFSTEQVCDISNCSFGKGAAYNTAAFSFYFCACFLVCTGPTGDSLRAKLRKKRKARKKERHDAQKEISSQEQEPEKEASEEEKRQEHTQEPPEEEKESKKSITPSEEGHEIDQSGAVSMETTSWC